MVTPRVVRAGPFPASHPCVERTTAGSTRLPEILRTFFRQGTTSTFGTGRAPPAPARRPRHGTTSTFGTGRHHRTGRHTEASQPRPENAPPHPGEDEKSSVTRREELLWAEH